MNNSHENTALSFERILFFGNAVLAIVITLPFSEHYLLDRRKLEAAA